MKLKGIIIIMAFSIFTACTKQTPESEFWKWFKKNESMIFDFEKDQEATFDKLAEAMSKVHPELTFEFCISISRKL